MERPYRAVPLVIAIGSLAAFFVIGHFCDLFGHDINWQNPATWAQFGCIPLALFGAGWAIGGVGRGLKWAASMALLFLLAAGMRMLRG